MNNKLDNIPKEQLDILKSRDLTVQQIAEKLNIGEATVSRWRKKLNIIVPKGVLPGTVKKEKILWKCSGCNKSEFRLPGMAGTKFCSRSCLHKDDSYKEKLRNADKSYMQDEDYKKSCRSPNTPDFIRYRNAVHRLSQKTYEQNIDKINPNGYNRAISGVDGGWQLDHIIPIKFGFDNNIPVEILCEVSNLRMLPWRENLARNKKD